MGSDEERTMKIYQELEKITGFRFLNNDEIKPVLKDYVRTGKFDEPKKNAILIMILERLCKLEEDYEVLLTSLPDVIDRRVSKILEEKEDRGFQSLTYKGKNVIDIEKDKPFKVGTVEVLEEFQCECGKVAKSKLGLIAHKRSHKTKV